MAKLLLENGAYVNVKDGYQATPLHRAVQQGFNAQNQTKVEKNLNSVFFV